MSDVSTTLPLVGSRPFPAMHGGTMPLKPMGVGATLAWGALAYAGLFTFLIVQYGANAWAGHPVQLPGFMYDLPVGHFVAAAVVLLAIYTSGQPIRAYLGMTAMRHRDVWIGIGLGVAMFVGMIVLFIVTGLINHMLGGAPPQSADMFKGVEHKWQLILAVYFLMVVVAPVVEEMMFRGLMYRGLAASGLGVVGAMILTSVVFGLAHAPGWGWERAVVTGFVGLGLAVIRWRTGGTSMGMVSHAATNFVGASVLTAMILTAS